MNEIFFSLNLTFSFCFPCLLVTTSETRADGTLRDTFHKRTQKVLAKGSAPAPKNVEDVVQAKSRKSVPEKYRHMFQALSVCGGSEKERTKYSHALAWNRFAAFCLSNGFKNEIVEFDKQSLSPFSIVSYLTYKVKESKMHKDGALGFGRSAVNNFLSMVSSYHRQRNRTGPFAWKLNGKEFRNGNPRYHITVKNLYDRLKREFSLNERQAPVTTNTINTINIIPQLHLLLIIHLLPSVFLLLFVVFDC
jgi:hypothetical protein